MRLVIVELRRTPLRYAILALLALYLVLLWEEEPVWRGVWFTSTVALSSPWMILGPLMAGSCAWVVAQQVQHQSLPGDASVLASSANFTLFAAHLLLLVPMTVIPMAVVAVRTGLTPGVAAGWFSAAGLLVVISYAVEVVAIGHLVGLMAKPAWFAAALSLLLVFLRYIWGETGFLGEQPFLRVISHGPVHAQVDWGGAIVAAVEAVVVTASLLVVPALAERFARRKSGGLWPFSGMQRRRLVGAGIALIAGIVVVATSPSVTSERAPQGDPLCTANGENLQICLWPQAAVHLKTMEQLVGQAEEILPTFGFTVPNASISQYGLPYRDGNFIVRRSDSWGAASVIANMAITEPLDLECVSSSDEESLEFFHLTNQLVRALTASIQGESWPEEIRDTSGTDYLRADAVALLPIAEQKQWFADTLGRAKQLNLGWC